MQGHSKAYDTPIRKMAEILATGELGRVLHIQTWNWNDWLLRALVASEVDTAQGSGVVFRQAPHQIDIVRYLGGGKRAQRARVGRALRTRPIPDGEGNYTAFLEFEDGAAATMVFDGYGYFDVAELTWGIGESGLRMKNPESLCRARGPGPGQRGAQVRDGARGQSLRLRRGRRRRHRFAAAQPVLRPDRRELRARRAAPAARRRLRLHRAGAARGRGAGARAAAPRSWSSCATRSSTTARTLLDARWGMATTEVCLAILQSSRERREIRLAHQVGLPTAG